MRISNNVTALRIVLNQIELNTITGGRFSKAYINTTWDDRVVRLRGTPLGGYHEVTVGKGGLIATAHRPNGMPRFGTITVSGVLDEKNHDHMNFQLPENLPNPRARVEGIKPKIIKAKQPKETLADTVQKAHAITQSAEVLPILAMSDTVTKINQYKMALGDKLDLQIGKDGLLLAKVVLGS